MTGRFEREEDGQAFRATSEDFKSRCYTFLDVLCNDKDMERAATYLDPNCVLVHGDNPPLKGADNFIAAWTKNLAHMPDYHKDVQDIVVEMDGGGEGVARVWVYSRITGIERGKLTDSVDMMHFTANGLFLDSKDVQRMIDSSS